MKTIFVIYTDCPLVDLEDINSHKRYAFLCENDYITIGDMIEDKRYTTAMQVVAMSNNTHPSLNGILLKTIEPARVNGEKINIFNKRRAKEIEDAQKAMSTRAFEKTLLFAQHYSSQGPIGPIGEIHIEEVKQLNDNQMETRNLKITIEQAREWYNSGNATLKTLALNTFTEEELMMCLAYVYKNVETDVAAFDVPNGEREKFSVKADLAVLAKYFNGDWEMKPGVKGYFLGNFIDSCGRPIATFNKVGIYEHHTVQYEGITYFKSQESAIKAAKLLEDRLKLLFQIIFYVVLGLLENTHCISISCLMGLL